MVDTKDSKSFAGNCVRVQVSPPVKRLFSNEAAFFYFKAVTWQKVHRFFHFYSSISCRRAKSTLRDNALSFLPLFI